MGVTVTRTGTLPASLWDAAASRAVAETQLASLDRRVFVRGLDTRDAPFAPYSSGYAAQLRAAGESGRVDLNRSGKLRAAVASSLLEVTDDGARLGLRGPEAEVAAAVSVARPFFGVSPSDRAELCDAVRAEVLRALRGGR